MLVSAWPQEDPERWGYRSEKDGAPEHQKLIRKEEENVNLPELEQDESVKMKGKTVSGSLQGSQKLQKEALSSSKTSQGDALYQEFIEPQKKGNDKTIGQPLPGDDLEVERVPGQKWTPPPGKRRCSGNCVGCQTKCKKLNLQDCHSCHLNKVRMTNNNGCCNIGPCTNMKQIKAKKEKQGDESISGQLAENSNVDNNISNFENEGHDQDPKELEEDLHNIRKRNREKGGTSEALQKMSQIARLSVAGGTE